MVEPLETSPPIPDNLGGGNAYAAEPNQQQATTTPDPNGSQDGSQEGASSNGQPPAQQQGQPSAEEATRNLIEGWREDRQSLANIEKENTELKERLSKYEETDADLINLSEEERINKIVERREKARQATSEAERRNAESEIRFYRNSDSYFQANEQRVMKNVIDFNLGSIEGGIKMTKQQDEALEAAKGVTRYDERRKQQAAGAGSNTSQGTATTSYNPATDKNKSISQLYIEGGL